MTDAEHLEAQLPHPPKRQEGAGLARSAGLSGVATLASRVLGLLRDLVLATLFGAGHDMDAFVVAFRVPNLVRDLFAEGALSAAFVPTFTRRLANAGRTEAWHLGNNLLNALVVVTLTLVAVGFLFAKPLVTLYAGRFQEVPGKIELTIDLARVMLPFLTLAAVASALMGMLNSLHHYFVPALAPSMFNAATIACAILLAPVMPALGLPPILAVAIGALLGGIGQIAVQWPSLRREGFRYRATLDLRDRSLFPVLLLMGPGTLGLAATQLNLFVTTFLATSQGEGAVSWLQYAFRLMYLPLGLFGVSIATALLPAAARHAAANSRQDVGRTVADALSLMLAVNLPAAFGLIVLAPDIVRLLFEHGRFLPSDTLATAAAVRCYAVGLLGYSATRIASPVFYALGDSRIPALVSMTAVVINVVASLVLIGWLAFLGLALATSLAAIVSGALSVALLARRLGGLNFRAPVVIGLKVTAASAIMAGVVAAGVAVIRVPQGVALEALRLLAVIGIGLLTLSVVSRRLRIAEYSDLLTLLRGQASVASR
jgi:putative peptidoglycan lipid II flippase